MLPLPRPVSRRQSSAAETNIPMYGTITPDPAFPQDNSHPPDDPTSARPWESMASNVVKLNPARIRSYINRLPLFTRGVTLIIIILWFFSLFLKWLPEWGSLIPTQISIWAGTSNVFLPLLERNAHNFLNRSISPKYFPHCSQ